MLILVLSNLYALFDGASGAQSLEKMSFSDVDIEKIRKDLVSGFNDIKEPIRFIRNNLGFHTAEKLKGQKKGAKAFEDLNEEVFILIGRLEKIYFAYLSKLEK